MRVCADANVHTAEIAWRAEVSKSALECPSVCALSGMDNSLVTLTPGTVSTAARNVTYRILQRRPKARQVAERRTGTEGIYTNICL
jgi:hypothetical protein